MKPTIEMLGRIVGRSVDRTNATALIAGIEAFPAGLDKPHRLAQYLPQVMHESGGLRYDRELWGSTAAQVRYDTRTDLGNTPEADGDGFLYRGRGPIQVTGKANYTAFRHWCEREGLAPPDFVANPDAVLTDPWEGLSPIWYWSTHDLNRYADGGNIETITRRINGGLNGYDDRIRYFARSALVILGRDADGLRAFQTDNNLKADGVAGPLTRAALHNALKALPEPDAVPLDAVLLDIDRRLDALEANIDA